MQEVRYYYPDNCPSATTNNNKCTCYSQFSYINYMKSKRFSTYNHAAFSVQFKPKSTMPGTFGIFRYDFFCFLIFSRAIWRLEKILDFFFINVLKEYLHGYGLPIDLGFHFGFLVRRVKLLLFPKKEKKNPEACKRS